MVFLSTNKISNQLQLLVNYKYHFLFPFFYCSPLTLLVFFLACLFIIYFILLSQFGLLFHDSYCSVTFAYLLALPSSWFSFKCSNQRGEVQSCRYLCVVCVISISNVSIFSIALKSTSHLNKVFFFLLFLSSLPNVLYFFCWFMFIRTRLKCSPSLKPVCQVFNQITLIFFG